MPKSITILKQRTTFCFHNHDKVFFELIQRLYRYINFWNKVLNWSDTIMNVFCTYITKCHLKVSTLAFVVASFSEMLSAQCLYECPELTLVEILPNKVSLLIQCHFVYPGQCQQLPAWKTCFKEMKPKCVLPKQICPQI